MQLFNSTLHQRKQIEVIDSIENQIANNSLNFSTVEPIHNYSDDPRMCLTAIHFPKQNLINIIYSSLITPL